MESGRAMRSGRAFATRTGVVTTALLLSACGGGGGGGTAPATAPGQPPGGSGIVAPPTTPTPVPSATLFREVTAASGLNFRLLTSAHAMVDVTHGGIAIGDFNRNGLLDIFVTRGDLGPNLLYMNLGNLTFVDVATEAGVAFTRSATENYRHSGPIFTDMNGNGYPDLFIGGLVNDPSVVFRNNGDGTFTDVTAGSGLDTISTRHTLSASFGDYDLDGRPDLFLTHWGTPYDLKDIGDTQHLWRNVSEGDDIRFTSVSIESGIAASILTYPAPAQGAFGNGDWSFTATFARLTDSLYPDLLIAADYGSSRVFRNNGDGTFTNVTQSAVITDEFGMGSTVGDFLGAGQLDWFVTSIYAPPNAPFLGSIGTVMYTRPTGNRLYRNNGGVLSNGTSGSGVVDGGWGWGACAADFENNGRLDIVQANGWPHPHSYGTNRRDPLRLFVNRGDGRFSQRATEYGLVDDTDARAIVCADFNNNGQVDILLLRKAGTAAVRLWENTGTANNYLRVHLNGLAPNTEASGARVHARIGEAEQMREVTIGANYLSQVSPIQHFGIGSAASIDELRIEWPEPGVPVTVLTHVAANQTLIVDHPHR